MIPTYHIDSSGHLILLFVIPMLRKKICFESLKIEAKNDGLDYLVI